MLLQKKQKSAPSEPDGFEQSMRLVDEKKETSLDHRVTKLLGGNSLQTEHFQMPVEGFLVKIGKGVVR